MEKFSLAACAVALWTVMVPACAHHMPGNQVYHDLRIEVGDTEVRIQYQADVPQLVFAAERRNYSGADGKVSAERLDGYFTALGLTLLSQFSIELNGRVLTPQARGKYVYSPDGKRAYLFVCELPDGTATGNHQLVVEDRTYPRNPAVMRVSVKTLSGWRLVSHEGLTSSEEDGDGLSDPFGQNVSSGSRRVSLSMRRVPQTETTGAEDPSGEPNASEPPESIGVGFGVTRGDRPGENSRSHAGADPEEAETTATRKRLVSLLESDAGGWPSLLFLGLAFVWGAGHALAPGHGKTLVAAYLVGTKGRPLDAVFLGLVTTVSHTGVVILLFIVLILSEHAVSAEVATDWLTVGAGLLVVAFGAYLLYRRLSEKPHHHDHSHAGGHAHTHGPQGHSHDHGKAEPPGKVTWGSLLWLGITGGIVPCPTALLALFVSSGYHRLGLGLCFVLVFSLGLAGVLVVIGVSLVTGKGFLDRFLGEFRERTFRVLQVGSACIVLLIGLGMTWHGLMLEGVHSKIFSRGGLQSVALLVILVLTVTVCLTLVRMSRRLNQVHASVLQLGEGREDEGGECEAEDSGEHEGA